MQKRGHKQAQGQAISKQTLQGKNQNHKTRQQKQDHYPEKHAKVNNG